MREIITFGVLNFNIILLLISGFSRDVDVICGLLGDYTVE